MLFVLNALYQSMTCKYLKYQSFHAVKCFEFDTWSMKNNYLKLVAKVNKCETIIAMFLKFFFSKILLTNIQNLEYWLLLKSSKKCCEA